MFHDLGQPSSLVRRLTAQFACLLLVAVVAGCSVPRPDGEKLAQPKATLTPTTQWLGVLAPFATNVVVVLDDAVAPIPDGAERRPIQPGPSPSGPLTHMVDLISMPAVTEAQTFTLLPFNGDKACVVQSSERLLVARWVHNASASAEQNQTERMAVGEGAVGFEIRNSPCPFADQAYRGAHENARLLRLEQASYVVKASEIDRFDEVPRLFSPDDLERLRAAPPGTTLGRLDATVQPDLPRYWVTQLATPPFVTRVYRDGELVGEVTGGIGELLVDGDTTFVRTTDRRLERVVMSP